MIEEIYVSLEEAAMLEGIKYKTFAQKINRESSYIVKYVPSVFGKLNVHHSAAEKCSTCQQKIKLFFVAALIASA